MCAGSSFWRRKRRSPNSKPKGTTPGCVCVCVCAVFGGNVCIGWFGVNAPVDIIVLCKSSGQMS